MAKGGRGQCQKVGRTAGTGMLDGRVGRVAMSVAGGQCTVCPPHPRPPLDNPPRPESIGMFGLGDGQRGETVGWVGGGRASQQESSDAGRAGTRSPAGHVGRRTFVSEKQWRHLWGGADVAGLDGEVRGGKKRTMLPNFAELISLIIANAKLSSNLSLASTSILLGLLAAVHASSNCLSNARLTLIGTG